MLKIKMFNYLQTMVVCQPFSSKNPKMSQPNLDYTAPEVQQHYKCCTLSDMFSLGLVISSIFADGHSLMESNLSTASFMKNLECVSIFYFFCRITV